MSRYILLILSIIFCLIGVKMLMYKTGYHDHDFIFKIMGIIRSTFLIKNNKIIKEWRSVKVKGHAQEVLNYLSNLKLN